MASVAVAAHEIGHVMQKKSGYTPYKIRTALVPLANIGSFLAVPLVILGIILEFLVVSVAPGIGFNIAIAGVVAYGLSTAFALVTLPVELDASRRAKAMLVEEGIIDEEELYGASKVLKAAAMTYVAGAGYVAGVFSAVFVVRADIVRRRQKEEINDKTDFRRGGGKRKTCRKSANICEKNKICSGKCGFGVNFCVAPVLFLFPRS